MDKWDEKIDAIIKVLCKDVRSLAGVLMDAYFNE